MRDVYVPMMMQALMRPPRAGFSGEQNPDLLKNPNNGWLFQFGRRKPGVSAQQAQARSSRSRPTYVRTRNPNARPPALALVADRRSAIRTSGSSCVRWPRCSAASSAPCC